MIFTNERWEGKEKKRLRDDQWRVRGRAKLKQREEKRKK